MAYASKCKMTIFKIQTRAIHTPPKRASLIFPKSTTYLFISFCPIIKSFLASFNAEFVITSKIALLLGATAIISENHQQILEKKERQYNIGFNQACWINTQATL